MTFENNTIFENEENLGEGQASDFVSPGSYYLGPVIPGQTWVDSGSHETIEFKVDETGSVVDK